MDPIRWLRWDYRRSFRNSIRFLSYLRQKRTLSKGGIAIYKPDRLGDFILAIGSIRQIIDEFGEENVTLILSKYGYGCAEIVFPNIKRIVIEADIEDLSGGISEYLKPLEGVSFSKAISLRHHRTSWQQIAFKTIQSGIHIGLENSGFDLLWPERSLLGFERFGGPAFPKQHGINSNLELEAHRLVLQFVLGRPIESSQIVPIIESKYPTDPRILLCPFTSSTIRDIPSSLIISVLKRKKELGEVLNVRLCGPRNEAERYRGLAKLLEDAGCGSIEICLTESLKQLVNEVDKARVLFAADSAPAHIATALDKPVVALLGGGHYGTFAPWQRSDRQKWLTAQQPCFGCNWRCVQTEPKCITAIEEDRIVSALSQVMSYK